MARPEGFEPPTPRSVVRSNPQLRRLREKATPRSGLSQLPLFHLNVACFMSMWKQVGNKIGAARDGSVAPGRALTRNKKPVIARRFPVSRCALSPSYPQICNLQASQKRSKNRALSRDVSMMFPSFSPLATQDSERPRDSANIFLQPSSSLGPFYRSHVRSRNSGPTWTRTRSGQKIQVSRTLRKSLSFFPRRRIAA